MLIEQEREIERGRGSDGRRVHLIHSSDGLFTTQSAAAANEGRKNNEITAETGWKGQVVESA